MSQGGACKLYLENTWNEHVSYMAAKFLSKRSTNGLYGGNMHLCKFYGRKYSVRKEVDHLREAKEVGLHANGKETYKKMKKRKEKARNNYDAVTVKKGGLKKAHISLSRCQNRVNEECILGFWAAPDAMVMSICPNSAQI